MKATIKDGIVYSPYPKVEIPSCSVYTAMKHFLTESPEQLAVLDDHTRLTRGEFLSRLRRFAAGFQAHGVGPGDRVCVHIGNSVENLVALFSITFTGASVLLSNPMLNESELLFQVDHSDATHILTSSQWAAKARAIQEKSKVRGLFLMDGDVPGFVSISNFGNKKEDDFKEVPIPDPKNTTVALYYSSGTTGHAKGVEITHYSVIAHLHQTLCVPLILNTGYGTGSRGAHYQKHGHFDDLGLPNENLQRVKGLMHGRSLVSYDHGDVLLTWYPITYASGFTFTPVAVCAGAVCVVTNPGLSFDQLVHYINKYQVTILASIPTRLYYYVADMLRTGTKLPSVKKINVGGTVLTRAFAERIMAAFDDLRSLRNHYGMSESCGVLCSPPNGDMASGSVGFPAPMAELKFLDLDTGEKVGPRQNGELYFRIPSVAKGYYKNPELTREFKGEDGWFRSGDIMYYDEDGRVYFVDRVKDIIKCLDQQVSSVELESLLQSHGSVADAAVVGVQDTRYGDAPAAFVVLRNSSKPPAEIAAELKALVADQTEKFKHLYGGVVFVDRLPRNTNGKVMKQQLKAMYEKCNVY